MPLVPNELKVLLVGHVSLDRRKGLLLGGGPPLYQIPVLLAYGIRFIDVLTSTTKPEDISEFPEVRIFNELTENNTIFTFENNDKEGEDDRLLILESKASKITTKHLDRLYTHYDLVIISGITDEISIDFVDLIRSKFQEALICVDAQSFARTTFIGENVKIKSLDQKIIHSLNGDNMVLKGSFVELNPIDNLTFDGVLLRTNHGEDIEFIFRDIYNTMKFDKVTHGILDGTGSGDIFLTCFAIEYLCHNNVYEAIHSSYRVTREFLFVNGVPDMDPTRTILEEQKVVVRE